MKSHMDFVNELRTPVRAFRRREQERKRKQAAQNGDSAAAGSDDLTKQLEAKFYELFGPCSDDE